MVYASYVLMYATYSTPVDIVLVTYACVVGVLAFGLFAGPILAPRDVYDR